MRQFIAAEVRPRLGDHAREIAAGDRWSPLAVIEELKVRARAAGLWNLFMPPAYGQVPVEGGFVFDGPGLSNLRYALYADEMGRIGRASEVFNCSAPIPVTWRCCCATARARSRRGGCTR